MKHALSKARAVAVEYKDSWIIGADTVVVIDNKILGKPVNREDSFSMLRQLSGKKHQVLTGYCLINSSNEKYISNIVCTDVTFNHLTDEIIDYYIESYSPFDKAGSYAIQDFSAVFVKDLRGCYYNVMGFPISAFAKSVSEELYKCL